MDILAFIEKGGVIVYILIALNIIGFSIMLLKMVNLYLFNKNKQIIVDDILNQLKNSNSDLILTHIDSLVILSIKRLEKGLNTIKIIATISPLLGLLGTVIGILSSFDVIGKVGLNDPMLFSSSISIALITTVTGLIVAIPHYIFYNYYIGILDNSELNLKDKVLGNL